MYRTYDKYQFLAYFKKQQAALLFQRCILVHVITNYSQTCFSDHLVLKDHIFCSLENGFSLKHVL